MTVLTAAFAIILALAFAGIGVAKLRMVPFMVTAADHLGIRPTRYRVIGIPELLAAGGLVASIAKPGIGIAACTGLAVLLIGAVVAHRRVGHRIAQYRPALVLLVLVVAELVLLGIA